MNKKIIIIALLSTMLLASCSNPFSKDEGEVSNTTTSGTTVDSTNTSNSGNVLTTAKLDVTPDKLPVNELLKNVKTASGTTSVIEKADFVYYGEKDGKVIGYISEDGSKKLGIKYGWKVYNILQNYNLNKELKEPFNKIETDNKVFVIGKDLKVEKIINRTKNTEQEGKITQVRTVRTKIMEFQMMNPQIFSGTGTFDFGGNPYTQEEFMELQNKVMSLEMELSNPSLLYTETGEDTTSSLIGKSIMDVQEFKDM